MKWEKYKSLTQEQKEEYNFKFRKPHISMVGSYSLWICMLLLIFALNMFIFYLTIKDPIFEQFKSGLATIFSALTVNVRIFSILIVVFIIIEVGGLIFNILREHLWLKKYTKKDGISEK